MLVPHMHDVALATVDKHYGSDGLRLAMGVSRREGACQCKDDLSEFIVTLPLGSTRN